MPTALADDPSAADPVEADCDRVYLDRPTASLYSAEEQSAALQELKAVMPKTQREKFFAKWAQLVTEPDQV
jgi:hypothetical protein